MGRSLGYDDATRMLGGDAAKVQQLVDVLVGTGMLALVGPFRDLLGWFDAKAELSKLTERLITGLVERRQSLSRYERTERLRAAHTILALTAFFEVMAEAELPVDIAGLRLTADEQQALAGRAATSVQPLVHGPAGSSVQPPVPGPAGSPPQPPVPGPAESHEEFRARLADFYAAMAEPVVRFGSGLAVWERLGESVLDRARAAIEELAEPAVTRFESMLGRLAAEFPEVAFWAGMREHTAVHARLRDVTGGLAALGEVLDAIAAGRAPDERRASLARAYAAALDRSIADTGSVPAGLRLPTLGQAFVAQAFRAAEVTEPTALSSENWWETNPVRHDLPAFLAGRITEPAVTSAPMLILGQPGSGKSVLARILAARLPANDFLPVLVELRSVHAAADVQEQIEQAIRAETGERVEWPALSRSRGDALPVVILDGFDELLQATGVSQTDYLMRVAAFQRREADLGRPVAVIVTSRISVADRAKTPEGAVAVRLEPFDRPRVEAWLATWNRVNSGSIAELEPDTVLRYPDLAGQPLLLLMLAIYDAEGNSLRSAGALRPDQLYERLLERFARREVDKRAPGLPPRDRDRLTELELRKLSVVAFAMFNRGAQWVTEEELDADLSTLPGLVGEAPAPAAGLRAPIRAAEMALGSFFFVHRAQAKRADDSPATYEFLHATFGEFLVARLIHRVIGEMVARERMASFVTGAATDDALLHALLSFAPLAGRRQVIVFVREMENHADWVDLLARLFAAAQQPRLPDVFEAYLPRRLTVQARIAAHTSNLLILTLCAADITASRLTGGGVGDWQDLALLWHSQGTASGWIGLIDLVQVDRIRGQIGRDVALSLHLNGPATVPPVDMNWVLDIDRPAHDDATWIVSDDWQGVRREVHFTCDSWNDFQQHAIEVFRRAAMDHAGGLVYLPTDGPPINILAAFLRLQYDSDMTRTERDGLYWATVAWINQFQGADNLLLRTLELDRGADLGLVSDIVRHVLPFSEARGGEAVLRCVSAHLDPSQNRSACEDLAYALVDTFDRDYWTEVHLDVAIRLAEHKLPAPTIDEDRARRLLETFAAKRPDFVSRIKILIKSR